MAVYELRAPYGILQGPAMITFRIVPAAVTPKTRMLNNFNVTWNSGLPGFYAPQSVVVEGQGDRLPISTNWQQSYLGTWHLLGCQLSK